MTNEGRQWLLQRARSAIAARVSRTRREREVLAPHEVRRAKCGIFVSLHTHERNELRGCVGYLHCRRSLERDVVAVAQQAAFTDHRFSPVASAEELAELDIEISLLSPFEIIASEHQIVLGTHGAYIEIAGRTGLLLPQVAEGRNWSVEDFLMHVCAKAGRRDICWRHPEAVLYRFTAEVFDDRSLR
ncbi:MAG: AmmeMemoRadiSam system protein A [Spirochaetaceae bacterium]|nr:MAG: AmmeMemoRadiSam system protein A [Spirochaetaceae bacterium]